MISKLIASMVIATSPIMKAQVNDYYFKLENTQIVYSSMPNFNTISNYISINDIGIGTLLNKSYNFTDFTTLNIDIYCNIITQATSGTITFSWNAVNSKTGEFDSLSDDTFNIAIKNNFDYLAVYCDIDINYLKNTLDQLNNDNNSSYDTLSVSTINIVTNGTELIPPTQEIIDIPTLIFTILTLPFTFISNAFNLTIFEGTPYELNFANLFLLIIGGLTLIFLIRYIVKMKL